MSWDLVGSDAEDLDALDAQEEGRDVDDEDAEIIPAPARRTKFNSFNAKHRQAPATAETSGVAWLVGKSREELNAEAQQRLPEMQKSRQSRMVSGLSTEGAVRAGRPRRTDGLGEA